jgi:chromosome segregation ATPase
MTQLAQDGRNGIRLIGGQPIALAGATLLVILAGIAGVALWRASASSSTAPELNRAVIARKLRQARAAMAAKELSERTKGLELTEQESIDQLQALQDDLQGMKRQLAVQQSENEQLSKQVSDLTQAMDGLQQSIASTNAKLSTHEASRHHRHHAKTHAIKKRATTSTSH